MKNDLQKIEFLPTRQIFLYLTFLLLGNFQHLSAQVNLQITELFPGQSGADLTADWFEITNTGDQAWVSGTDPELFYDDESASAADADLIQGITDIQPGEYVIVLITGDESDIAIFTSVWGPDINLDGIEIGYTDGAGLGGSGDAVNIWIGDPTASSPVDTEAYPATDNNDGQSYDTETGAFSTVGNASNAVQTTALGGDGSVPNTASPGNQGPVMADPDAPVIRVDPATATPYLTLSEEGPSAIGADVNDPADPAATIGIPFVVTDQNTDLQNIALSAASDNQEVVPDANLALAGENGSFSLTITPATAGIAAITLTATDDEGKSGTYTINYAVSASPFTESSARLHYGASDGSTALAVDNDNMWVADDEDQVIRLYNRSQSGMPLSVMDFDGDLGSDDEIDLEGSFRNGAAIYWMGSHTNTDRSVIFSTIESGNGATAQLTFTGAYRGLREDLMNWDANDGHGLGANFLGLATGLEIEGLSADPNNANGALLGFRSLLSNGRALVVPVMNFQAIVMANPVPNTASFGTPIELDLAGHSIRSIDCSENGCLIVAGPAGRVTDFSLYTWSGNPADTPELRAVDLAATAATGNIEGIVALPTEAFQGAAGDNLAVQLLIDTGTFDYYGDGSEAKDLPNDEWKKFRTEQVQLGAVTEAPVAIPGDVVITEIMQNPNAVADGSGEWFELYNNTGSPIDLNGWIIGDAGSDSHLIANGEPLMLAAGSYLVLGNNADQASNGGVDVAYAYGNDITLANGADELVLVSTDLLEIDRVEWDGGPVYPDPTGASMALLATNLDNNNGVNWCEAMTAYGNGDLGTPGAANDCPQPAGPDLQVTEIWMGQDGTDLTPDWFEVTNFGEAAWTAGIDPDLYYDDESQDPASAVQISGISTILPGQSAIVVIDAESGANTFSVVWSPVYDLTGVPIGWADGAGLGQGGDAVTLFQGTPSPENVKDYETYPAAPSGISYDVVVQAFSAQGTGTVQTGTNIAVATIATGGADGTEPAVGSPGNIGPLQTQEPDLRITEIFPGQAGDDLTADWFEIRNDGTAPWTSGLSPILFYDDESAEAADADTIMGLGTIAPGASAVILVTDNPSDVDAFREVWSPVIDLTGVEIGYTDGAGLGGGGDAVTLWLGDPSTTTPVDTASYPDTDAFDGRSYDVELGAFSEIGNANGAVQTAALGGNNMDVPNIGSPGNGLAVPASTGLVITEIFPGQAGDDLTPDWFEIRNTGNEAWLAGEDPDLFYDDESAAGADADPILGLTRIDPGASAIVLITDTPDDIAVFSNVWSPVIDLSGVEIGYTDGAGLGGGGDAVTLWLGDPNATSPIDTASYPDTEAFDGLSYDVELMAFSEVGNANGAVQTLALGGDNMDVPNIGSPGNGLAVPAASGLVITEVFSGQAGDDLTADWFEIKNTGDEAWIPGEDPELYYDDESAEPADADLIQGLTRIEPGASAIVLITDNPDDTTAFSNVWSAVIDLTGIEIGYTDGAGLGGGGDAVTLWLGNPVGFLPIDTASYPDTEGFDGRSYDVELAAFSEVGNANGAVQTLALGGDNMDVPNIGSPGNQGAVVNVAERTDAYRLEVYPNPNHGKIRVELPDGQPIEAAEIFDVNGQLLFRQAVKAAGGFDLDFSVLPASVYILRISGELGMSIRKIIRQ